MKHDFVASMFVLVSVSSVAALLAASCTIDEADVDTALLLAEEGALDPLDDDGMLVSPTPSATSQLDPCPFGCNDPPTQCAANPGQCIVDPATGTGYCYYPPVFPGTACDSPTPCVIASCVGYNCVPDYILEPGSLCDDGLPCTDDDACEGLGLGVMCVGEDQCADGQTCTPGGCDLACDPEQEASVSNLYYPGWTCEDAIANAESNLNMFHYRKACQLQVGSEITSAVEGAIVTDCHVEPESGQTVVSVTVCCA